MRLMYFIGCFLFTCMVSAQSTINRIEYFFDNDPGLGNATAVSFTSGSVVNERSFNVNINSLSNGFHNLFMRSRNSNGLWSLTAVQTLYKQAAPFAAAHLVQVEYFINNDPGYGKATQLPITAGQTDISISFNTAIDSLPTGFYTLHIRSRNATGKWSLNAVQIMYKQTAPAIPANLAQVEYFINNDPGYGKATQLPIAAGQTDISVSFNATIDSLPPGFHALHIRSRNATGRWSLNAAQIIYKQALPATAPNLAQVEYFFNQDPGMGNGIHIDVPAGQVAATIDVNAAMDSLPDGFHHLYARSRYENGLWSLTAMQVIYKQAMPDTIAPLVSRMEYFIGNDPGYGKATPIVFNAGKDLPSFLFAANIAGLATGNHLVQIRSMDTLGRWSLNAIDTIAITTPTSSQAIVINSLIIPPAQATNPSGDAPATLINSNNMLLTEVATNSVGLTLCAGKTIKLAFDPKGSFTQDNIFTVQLSNRNGSFSNPINIGTINGTSGSIVTLQLPRHLTSGTNYKLRINSNMPALTGDPLDSALTINDIYVGADSTILHDCLNQTTNLRNVYKTTGLTSIWNTPTPTAAPPGNYWLIVNNSTNCPDTAYVGVVLPTAIWTGAVSTNWHIAGNWSSGKVPDAATHVIVQGITTNVCIISQENAFASSVQLKNGGTLQQTNGRQLFIDGKCAILPTP